MCKLLLLVITNSSTACRWMLHLWILRCLHLQEGSAHRHFGPYPSMSTVHAGAPHHSEVQTTAGPAAGITVQTRQYIDNAFVQHPINSCKTSQIVLLTFMFPSYNQKTEAPPIHTSTSFQQGISENNSIITYKKFKNDSRYHLAYSPVYALPA